MSYKIKLKKMTIEKKLLRKTKNPIFHC